MGPLKKLPQWPEDFLSMFSRKCAIAYRSAFKLRGAKDTKLVNFGRHFIRAVRKNYQTFYAQTRSVLDSLDLNWPVRNWVGAHFNEWAKHTSRQDTVRFGEAVAGLFDAVFCPQCRKFITPSNRPYWPTFLSLRHAHLSSPGEERCCCGGQDQACEGIRGCPSRRPI